MHAQKNLKSFLKTTALGIKMPQIIEAAAKASRNECCLCGIVEVARQPQQYYQLSSMVSASKRQGRDRDFPGLLGLEEDSLWLGMAAATR